MLVFFQKSRIWVRTKQYQSSLLMTFSVSKRISQKYLGTHTTFRAFVIDLVEVILIFDPKKLAKIRFWDIRGRWLPSHALKIGCTLFQFRANPKNDAAWFHFLSRKPPKMAKNGSNKLDVPSSLLSHSFWVLWTMLKKQNSYISSGKLALAKKSFTACLGIPPNWNNVRPIFSDN